MELNSRFLQHRYDKLVSCTASVRSPGDYGFMSKLLLLLSCVAPLLAQTTQSDVAPAQSETAPAQSDHSGPSVLSRGIGSGMFSSTLGYFRPHVGLNGVYNSQL